MCSSINCFSVTGLGAFDHEVPAGRGLGEGDDLADAGGLGKERDQPVDAQGNAAVRGCAILEGFEQVTKL